MQDFEDLKDCSSAVEREEICRNGLLDMESEDWMALVPTDTNGIVAEQFRVSGIHFEQETPQGLRFHVSLLVFRTPSKGSSVSNDPPQQRYLRVIVGRDEEEIVDVDWNAGKQPEGDFV